jgi:DNA replication initiation complex subunit (GINS family)
MIKLLAKINGERVELTPKEQRELVRRRAAWRRRAELEPPLVLADHPRALPSGEHPLTRSLARLNTLT